MIALRKKYNALIAALLALLGFPSACDLAVDEYGAPSADFIVNGNVTDTRGANLQNIQVVMEYDTTYTDTDGNYRINSGYFTSNQNFLLQFKSIEGISPGEYSPLDTVINFSDLEFTGSDGDWYEGKKEKTIDVKLKPEH